MKCLNCSNAWSLASIKTRITKSLSGHHSGVLNQCALINSKRIYYFSVIAIPIRIINIFLFVTGSAAMLAAWSRGIIISHFTFLVFLIGVFLISHRLKQKTQANMTMRVLQYIVPISIMAFGITIVTIDQLVTTNITPFLFACIAVGSIFLIRPLFAVVIYLIAYLAYYYLIAINIASPEVLLSNRVNGVSAVAIGFLISVLIWHYNYINLIQKQRIEAQQQQLEQMAYHDPLTDLPNRHYFYKVIKEEFSLMQIHGHESVIMILDIDNFKKINDTYGHLVGDQILKQLARLLIANVREFGTVSRFGGEEFVVLMPKKSLDEGLADAERLRKLIAENRFDADSTTLQITASIGVSLLQPTADQGFGKCFSQADRALYLAKSRGKNRVEKYDREA